MPMPRKKHRSPDVVDIGVSLGLIPSFSCQVLNSFLHSGPLGDEGMAKKDSVTSEGVAIRDIHWSNPH